jgi:uncharacterized membrane protein YkoI
MNVAKRLTCTVAIVAVALPGTALAYTGQEMAPMAKISMAQATTIALKARAGTVADSELERERGGSGLRYSFDIKSGLHTYELGVDAKTGKLLENSREGAHAD